MDTDGSSLTLLPDPDTDGSHIPPHPGSGTERPVRSETKGSSLVRARWALVAILALLLN